MSGFPPSNRTRRSLAGAILAILLVVARAPGSAEAGCHRGGEGRTPGIEAKLDNLQSLGALANPRGVAETPAPPRYGREGCSGPFCSSNADPVSTPSSFVSVRLQSEWPTIDSPPPADDPAAAPAAPETRSPWSNPPLADVFHPPRRLAGLA